MTKGLKAAIISITALIVAAVSATVILLGINVNEGKKEDNERKNNRPDVTYSESTANGFTNPEVTVTPDETAPSIENQLNVNTTIPQTIPSSVPHATQPAPVTQPVTAPPAPSYIVATESDISELCDIASRIGHFNINSPDATLDAYDMTIGMGYVYNIFYRENVLITDSPDPLNRFGSPESGFYEYNRFNADKADWIIRNVFGLVPDHNLSVNAGNSGSHHPMYYYDGYYYTALPDFGGGGDYGDVVEKSVDSNGVYTVKIEVLDMDGSVLDYTVVKAKLHTVDGEKVWQIYEIAQ